MLPKKKILQELPRRIQLPPDEFGLKNEKYNSRIVSTILAAKNKSMIESFGDGRDLWRYKNKFILIDSRLQQVLYYLSWREEHYNFFDRMVATEVLHWRNRGQYMMGLSNLTQHVFFDLLLPLYGAILSDRLHTSYSEAFWVKMIEAAFNRDIAVYYVNFIAVSSNINREIIRLYDRNDFLNLVNPNNPIVREPWGNDEKYESRKFLLTLEPLKSESV